MKKAVSGLNIPVPPISGFKQPSGQHFLVNTLSAESLAAVDETTDLLRIRA